MPRDSSGNYTLPIENPVVDGTIITSDWANNTLNDIALQLNNVVTRDGVLGMVGPFKFADGTVAAPSITFNSEPGLGFYRQGPGVLALARGGVKSIDFSDSGIGVLAPAGKDARLILSKPANTGLNCFIAGGTNGIARWAVLLGDVTAETGANAGSNFRISRYADANSGAPFATSMYIERATGKIYLGNENSDNALTVRSMNYGGPGLDVQEAVVRSTIGGVQFIADAAVGNFSASYKMSRNNLNRWSIFCSNAAETGGNTGSGFGIARCDDAGFQIDLPLTIARNTGIVTIKTSLMSLEIADDTGATVGSLKSLLDTLESRIAALETP